MNVKEITNQTIFTIDWAKRDPRSVSAYLAGKGDGRVLWWNLNRLAHQLFSRRASLALIMFRFHSCHHAVTLFNLKCFAEVQDVADVIRSKGILAGIRSAASPTGENRHS